ncbi:MAG: hypothetical protein LBM96_04100 [Methanobrevibacter sp.]|nr:hypothetical protein [Candidatus Methanoflexus mossambicus]
MSIDNSEEIKKIATENSDKINALLEKDVLELKEKAISAELNKFFDMFNLKIEDAVKSKDSEQYLAPYINLSENRTVVITEMDIVEPWFVKIAGKDVNGENSQEILNSRSEKPEIIIEVL